MLVLNGSENNHHQRNLQHILDGYIFEITFAVLHNIGGVFGAYIVHYIIRNSISQLENRKYEDAGRRLQEILFGGEIGFYKMDPTAVPACAAMLHVS